MSVWICTNWITIVCTLFGAIVSILSTKYYYIKSISKYKSAINYNLMARTKSNWSHLDAINKIASNLQASNEKNEIVGHSANGLTDAGYIDGVIVNLLN